MFWGHFGSMCVCITFVYICVCVCVYTHTWVMYMHMCYIYLIVYIMYKGKALYYISRGTYKLTLCLLYLVKFKPTFTLLYVVLHSDICNYPQICVPIMFVYLFHKVCYVSRKYRYLFHWTLMSHEIHSTKSDTSCCFYF